MEKPRERFDDLKQTSIVINKHFKNRKHENK